MRKTMSYVEYHNRIGVLEQRCHACRIPLVYPRCFDNVIQGAHAANSKTHHRRVKYSPATRRHTPHTVRKQTAE